MIADPKPGQVAYVVTPECVRSGAGPSVIVIREVVEAWDGPVRKPYEVTVRGNRGVHRVETLFATAAEALRRVSDLASSIGEEATKNFNRLRGRLAEAERLASELAKQENP